MQQLSSCVWQFSVSKGVGVLEVDTLLQLSYKWIPDLLNIPDHRLQFVSSLHRSYEMLLRDSFDLSWTLGLS